MTEQERNIYQTALRRCREYAESLTAILGIAFGLNPAQVMRDYIIQK